MTYKTDKIPLGIYDRRVKLTEVQRNEVKEFRRQGLSYNAIAKLYDVSKSLIIMVCNPDIAERKRIACMERHREGRYKYTKEEWAAVQRESIERINENYIRRAKYNYGRFSNFRTSDKRKRSN